MPIPEPFSRRNGQDNDRHSISLRKQRPRTTQVRLRGRCAPHLMTDVCMRVPTETACDISCDISCGNFVTAGRLGPSAARRRTRQPESAALRRSHSRRTPALCSCTCSALRLASCTTWHSVWRSPPRCDMPCSSSFAWRSSSFAWRSHGTASATVSCSSQRVATL